MVADVDKESKLLLSPYVAGALEALGVQANIVLEASEPNRELPPKEKIDIAGKLSMDCPELNVDVILSFPKDVYFNIYESMLDERPDDINDENRDLAAEITNMIYGQAKTTLKKRGYEFGRAFPVACSGDELSKIYPENFKDRLMVSFSSEIGTFYLELIVKE